MLLHDLCEYCCQFFLSSLSLTRLCITRYFILKGSKLFFSKSETSTPHGMIDLSACMTVKSAELKAGKRNAIEVSTADTTFFMFADTEKEKDEWIGAIGRAIVQASATFTTEDDRHSDKDSDDSYNEGY